MNSIFARIQSFLRREERGEINAMGAIGEAPELLRGAEKLILDQQTTISQITEQRDRQQQAHYKHDSRQRVETSFQRMNYANAQYQLDRLTHSVVHKEEWKGDGTDGRN